MILNMNAPLKIMTEKNLKGDKTVLHVGVKWCEVSKSMIVAR